MSYDQRNQQEITSRVRRHTDDLEADTAQPTTSSSTSGGKSMRWTLMLGLALLATASGFRLGRDQYNIYKS